MKTNSRRLASLVVIVWFAAGCAGKPGDRAPRAGETAEAAETGVRQKFAEIQAAIKARDADRLWGLLSGKSRAEAEKEAQAIRATYKKATAAERAALEKELGVGGQELAKLTGPGFLETRRFLRKYEDVVGSTITRVTASGDSAMVYFDDREGDHEKMVFLREGGQWKAWLTMPKAK
jgi:hypothetical protein